jgi:hypothetical protein
MGARKHGESRYRIRLRGVLDARWGAHFGGLSLSSDDDRSTIVDGIRDQCALLGVLRRIHSLGVEIIDVTRLDSEQASQSLVVGTAANHNT